MGAINLDKFGGMLPAWSDRLIPPGQAAIAQNLYMFSGELVGWRVPKLLRALSDGAAKRAFRVPVVAKAAAQNTLTFHSNPNAGDTIKIGEDVYTWVSSLISGGAPFTVVVGASAPGSALNFFNAVTGDAGLYTNRGITYGASTTQSSFVDNSGSAKVPPTADPNIQSASVNTFFAPDFGAAFNNTVVTESSGGVRMQWANPTFTGGANATFDNTVTGASTWLEFEDADTDIIRSPVVDDSFQRYYFASPSQAPQYNTYDRIVAGQAPFLLGIRAPGCAPIVEVAGGSDLAQLGFPTSTSAGTTPFGANTLTLIPITPTGALQINDVSFMPGGTDAAGDFAGVLYQGDGVDGAPGTLLNVGAIIVGATTGIAVTSAFTNPTPLLANVKYWIGFVTNSNVPVAHADALTTAGAVTALATFSNGPPDVAPVVGAYPADPQIWADLTTSAVLEARAYVYTWVSEFGEEGPPSPATTVTGWSNATWTVSLYQPQPDDLGIVRDVKTVRLYRTIPDNAGSTQFFFVSEQPIGTATYVDNIDDSVVALNTILQSIDWFGPPEGLQGFVSMPNGMIAGFKANEIWFCEPYQPHAWPAKYVITTEFPIIGLGSVSNTLVIPTSGQPYVAMGPSPGTMTMSKVAVAEPCIARGSILSTEGAVFYCSPNGLVAVNSSGSVVNKTETWITRERWRKLIPQKNLRAVLIESLYFCYGTKVGSDNAVAQQGFTLELSSVDADSFSIWPQPGGHRMGLVTLTAPNNVDIDNVFVDPWSGTVMMIQASNINYYDFNDQSPLLMPWKWRSGIFVQKEKENYAAFRATFDVPPNTPAQSATRFTGDTTDPLWNSLQAGQYLVVRVFANPGASAQLVTVREVRTDSELLRILCGFKAFEWQFELEGVVTVANMQVATSVKELRKI